MPKLISSDQIEFTERLNKLKTRVQISSWRSQENPFLVIELGLTGKSLYIKQIVDQYIEQTLRN